MATDAPLLRHEIGSVFKKDYKGKTVVVKVTKHGYMYNDKPYRTLSAAVHKITGRPTPANVFFGLETTPRGEKKKKVKTVTNGEDHNTEQEDASDSTPRSFGERFESAIRKIMRDEIKNYFRSLNA